jgi:hypothetical protein
MELPCSSYAARRRTRRIPSAAFGGLLDRQRDTTAFEVDVDDLDPELFARGDHLLAPPT